MWLHVLMGVLTCTRWLSLSATMIRLWLSHATPAGRSNWPGREPREPNLWWKAPQGLNIWRRKEQNIAHLFQFNVTTLYQLYCKALTLNCALKANPVLFLLMSSPSKANDICENHPSPQSEQSVVMALLALCFYAIHSIKCSAISRYYLFIYIDSLVQNVPSLTVYIQLRESLCRRSDVGGNKFRALFNSKSCKVCKSDSLLHKHFSTNASTVCSSHLLLSRWLMTHFQCNLSKNDWNWQ